MSINGFLPVPGPFHISLHRLALPPLTPFTACTACPCPHRLVSALPFAGEEAVKNSNTRHRIRSSQATRVEFEHRDGLYWLDCRAVEQTASVLGLRCQGHANGFDATLAHLYMRRLLDKRFAVFVRKANAVSKVSLPRRHSDVDQVESTPLLLSPDLVLGRRYLQQLSCLAAKSRSFLAAAGAMERRLLSGEDVGEPVVYQVAADMYEVDWSLTVLTERAFEALALAAYRLGRPLACRLVLPKPRRGRAMSQRFGRPVVGKPVTYGQLRLAI